MFVGLYNKEGSRIKMNPITFNLFINSLPILRNFSGILHCASLMVSHGFISLQPFHYSFRVKGEFVCVCVFGSGEGGR